MKTVTIDELLSWAFVHELPKGGGVDGLANANSAWRMLEASSWGKITSFAELGTLVDARRGDASNFLFEQGEPHEDAVEAGRAVAALAACDVVIPDGWNALSDWPDTGGLAEAAVANTVARYRARTAERRGREIVSLLVGTAILGREPPTASEPSRVRMVERSGRPAWFVMRRMTDRNGQTYDIEVDGYNARTGRPMRGAYRKHELSIDPAGDVMSRFDYQLWVAALRHLERELAARMIDHRIVACDRSMTPWLASDRPGIRLVVPAAKKTAPKC